MEYTKQLEEMEEDGQFSVSQTEKTGKKDAAILDNQLDIKVLYAVLSYRRHVYTSHVDFWILSNSCIIIGSFKCLAILVFQFCL